MKDDTIFTHLCKNLTDRQKQWLYNKREGVLRELEVNSEPGEGRMGQTISDYSGTGLELGGKRRARSISQLKGLRVRGNLSRRRAAEAKEIRIELALKMKERLMREKRVQIQNKISHRQYR